MAVVLVVVCSSCGTRWQAPERTASVWPARVQAARCGWSHVKDRGQVLDVCPGCIQASRPLAVRAAEQAASAVPAPSGPVGPAGPVHAVALVEDDVVLCGWCEAGDCTWCTGCECTSLRHTRVPAAV